MANILRILNVLGPFLISVLLIFFAAFDIVHDISRNDGFEHIIAETVIFFLGLLLNIFFVHRTAIQLNQLSFKNETIGQELRLSRDENENLKTEQQKFREGLYQAIEQQMQKWHLSKSEIEIAFLLIKGLSNKEIANIRNTSESTVRLQCSSIYRKSSVTSRSELAAYFLEDMI